FWYGHVPSIAAVHIAARGPKIGAQIFISLATRRMNPAHADPVPEPQGGDAQAKFVDEANHLMAQHYRQSRRRRATLDFIQLRVTYAARGYANADFTGCGLGRRQLREVERRRGFL